MRRYHGAVRLGILADIHEHVEFLRAALERCTAAGATEFVDLGDVFKDGRRIDETVNLLRSRQTRGVWGNHDFGLCHQPDERVVTRYAPETCRWLAGYRARLKIEGVLFQHIMPHRNPHLLEDLWQGGADFPDTPEKGTPCFAGGDWRVCLIGHYHRWLVTTPEGRRHWDGTTVLDLRGPERLLVVIDAIENGSCAVLDTDRWTLEPMRLTGEA